MYRKDTERVYAGGKDIERVEDGPDCADLEEKGGWAGPMKVQGRHTTQPITETVGEGLDARTRRRVEGEFGKNSKGSGRGEEQQTGCTC